MVKKKSKKTSKPQKRPTHTIYGYAALVIVFVSLMAMLELGGI